MTFARHLYDFYAGLRPEVALPPGIGWLYPQADASVLRCVHDFLHRYFDDGSLRTLLLGINPGRKGAGITGINFTAGRQLTSHCGMEHAFGNGSELSAEFIWEVIEAWGGAEAFHQRFFIGAVCPLGFVRGGKNINYYDDAALQKAVTPFIVKSMQALLQAPFRRDVCLCIGEGKNLAVLQKLNAEHRWFERIEALPHPRWVMQYRRKTKELFIGKYLQALKASAAGNAPSKT